MTKGPGGVCHAARLRVTGGLRGKLAKTRLQCSQPAKSGTSTLRSERPIPAVQVSHKVYVSFPAQLDVFIERAGKCASQRVDCVDCRALGFQCPEIALQLDKHPTKSLFHASASLIEGLVARRI